MIQSSRETIWPTEKYPSIELSDHEHLLRLGIDPNAPIEKKETRDEIQALEMSQSEQKQPEKESHAKKPVSRIKEKPPKDSRKPDASTVARVQKKR